MLKKLQLIIVVVILAQPFWTASAQEGETYISVSECTTTVDEEWLLCPRESQLSVSLVLPPDSMIPLAEGQFRGPFALSIRTDTFGNEEVIYLEALFPVAAFGEVNDYDFDIVFWVQWFHVGGESRSKFEPVGCTQVGYEPGWCLTQLPRQGRDLTDFGPIRGELIQKSNGTQLPLLCHRGDKADAELIYTCFALGLETGR